MNITNKSTIHSWSEFTDGDLAIFSENGDSARRDLIDPVIFSLMGCSEKKRVLDAGCGNGYLSRKLARHGAIVTGVEPATNLFNYCLKKEREEKLGIIYIQDDLSKFKSTATFDQIFIINVLMDIPEYEVALKNCIRSLTPGGEIIISLLHPAFPGFEDEWSKLGYVKISEYFNAAPTKQRYGFVFLRPISVYVNALISLGCSIENMTEPKLDSAAKEGRNKHVPQFLIIKARKIKC